ncbi:hypothetical protein CFC21_046175 [Triticum aestivum]|nr:uncharacterized protein LOC109777836 [Aegilops tauschii subsp. strangulata]XP_044352975.1 uncharacterized protein LOC123074099 [Triticum aestivum]KAF7035263.1 hypothetical protein CFC21_046175 [Triticum aestivum]
MCTLYMTMAKIILLLVLAPFCMAAASTDCRGVPALDGSSACGESCSTKLLQDLCIDVMIWGGVEISGSHKEGATGYVILAARFAVESLDATQLAARNQLSQNTSLSGQVRDAYEGCLNDYATVRSSINRVANEMLPNCRFAGVADEFARGVKSLESCWIRLMRPPVKSTPLYNLVWADRYKLLLIHLLDGKLLGI